MDPKIKRNRKLFYAHAEPPFKKRIQYVLEGIGIAALIDELFYREIVAMLPLFILSFFWIRYRKRRWREERKERLVLDFREALNALAVSLRSGISIENAIPEVYGGLKRTLGEQHDMTKEFGQMVSELRVGIPAETLFRDLAERSGCEEIRDFAAVFSAARRMGGNIAKMIRNASDRIGAGIETEQEIQTVLAAKKLEQKVMAMMPGAILGYLQLTSPDYLSALYHSIFGAGFMTVCLVLWLLAVLWGNSIVKIEC